MKVSCRPEAHNPQILEWISPVSKDLVHNDSKAFKIRKLVLIQHCYLITGRPHSGIAFVSVLSLQQRDPILNLELQLVVMSLESQSGAVSQTFLGFCYLSTYENSRPVILKTLSVWVLVFPRDLIQVVHLWQEPHGRCGALLVPLLCGPFYVSPTAD